MAVIGPPSVNLREAYAHEIRPIVEDCIRERESLPTVFNYGGSRDRTVVSYLIDVLGKTGNVNSISLLQELVDDPDLGQDAIHAVESIRRTIVQLPR